MILFYAPSFQYLSSAFAEAPPVPGTICVWYLSNALMGAGEVIWYQSANFQITTNATVKLRIRLARTGLFSSTLTLTQPTLYHFVFTWDASGNNTLYVNGVLNTSNTGTYSAPASNTIRIGSNATSQWMDGSMEDERMYNRILSLDEIETIYACRGSDKIHEGLIHRYVMMENAPGVAVTTVFDEVNSPNNLSPTNAPTYDVSNLKLRRRLN